MLRFYRLRFNRGGFFFRKNVMRFKRNHFDRCFRRGFFLFFLIRQASGRHICAIRFDRFCFGFLFELNGVRLSPRCLFRFFCRLCRALFRILAAFFSFPEAQEFLDRTAFLWQSPGL